MPRHSTSRNTRSIATLLPLAYLTLLLPTHDLQAQGRLSMVERVSDSSSRSEGHVEISNFHAHALNHSSGNESAERFEPGFHD